MKDICFEAKKSYFVRRMPHAKAQISRLRRAEVYPVMDVLTAIVSTIVATADPDKIILFGSRARNGVNPESDYDILVLKAGEYHKRKLAQELYRALAHIPVPIDLVVEDPSTAEKLRNVPGLIYCEALKGRVLYER